MSYNLSLLIHIAGILLLFAAFGGMGFHGANGGTKETNKSAGIMAALHGTGLLLILGGGFMMFGHVGISHGGPWPVWLMVKMGIWVVLGAYSVFFKRVPKAGIPLLLGAILLGLVSGYLAKMKPGAPTGPIEPAAEAPADGSAE